MQKRLVGSEGWLATLLPDKLAPLRWLFWPNVGNSRSSADAVGGVGAAADATSAVVFGRRRHGGGCLCDVCGAAVVLGGGCGGGGNVSLVCGPRWGFCEGALASVADPVFNALDSCVLVRNRRKKVRCLRVSLFLLLFFGGVVSRAIKPTA